MIRYLNDKISKKIVSDSSRERKEREASGEPETDKWL